MTLDIAMGGSTNTVLHLLAAAQEAEVDFTMADIDELSRRVPCLCKVAPNGDYLIEDVHRAGGIPAILGELRRGGLLHEDVDDRPRARRWTSGWAPGTSAAADAVRARRSSSSTPRPAACARRPRSRSPSAGSRSTLDAGRGLHPRRRARLLDRRRPGDPLRQPRRARLRREDRGRRRVDPDLQRPGASWSSPRTRRSTLILGGGVKRGRRGRDPLRGPARRPGHAGDALPDLLPQGPRARQGVRADHRRPLLRRHLGPVDRPRLARGGVRRRDRAGRERRHDRDRHPQPRDRRSRSPTTELAERRERARGRRRLRRRRRASASSPPPCAPTRRWRPRPTPAPCATSTRSSGPWPPPRGAGPLAS